MFKVKIIIIIITKVKNKYINNWNNEQSNVNSFEAPTNNNNNHLIITALRFTRISCRMLKTQNQNNNNNNKEFTVFVQYIKLCKNDDSVRVNYTDDGSPISKTSRWHRNDNKQKMLMWWWRSSKSNQKPLKIILRITKIKKKKLSAEFTSFFLLSLSFSLSLLDLPMKKKCKEHTTHIISINKNETNSPTHLKDSETSENSSSKIICFLDFIRLICNALATL